VFNKLNPVSSGLVRCCKPFGSGMGGLTPTCKKKLVAVDPVATLWL